MNMPAEWPQWRKDELAKSQANGRVGKTLVSETERVRVWTIELAPGERLGFHKHVLNYFWTATSAGQSRSHYGDGKMADAVYKPGDTRHYTFGEGEFMIHDLENTGSVPLSFVTVELKIGSANKPLDLG
jgi:mannose-6-phosphate isomerase-like protein (cupin superfamily)